MSADIINAESIRAAAGIPGNTFHGDDNGFNGLGMWMLQRLDHQRGRWYVQLYLRGLCICGYAVQDDFGNLQFVEAS